MSTKQPHSHISALFPSISLQFWLGGFLSLPVQKHLLPWYSPWGTSKLTYYLPWPIVQPANPFIWSRSSLSSNRPWSNTLSNSCSPTWPNNQLANPYIWITIRLKPSRYCSWYWLLHFIPITVLHQPGATSWYQAYHRRKWYWNPTNLLGKNSCTIHILRHRRYTLGSFHWRKPSRWNINC